MSQISLQCPFCGHLTIFQRDQYTVDGIELPAAIPAFAAFLRCTNQLCRRIVFARLGGTLVNEARMPNLEAIYEQYPKRLPGAPDGTPQVAADDLTEAIKCYDIGAYNASVAICRRAIQSAVLHLGGEGRDLYHQIDDLKGKQEITPELAEWAHSIRDAGKLGAHADLNIPDNIEEADAGEIIDFTTEFFRYRFSIKERVRARAKRDEAPQRDA